MRWIETDAQIAEAVRAKGGDMTDAILSGYNLVVPQQTPQQAPQPAPQEAPKPQVVVQMPAEPVEDDWRFGPDRGEGLTGVFRGVKEKAIDNIKYMDEVSKRKKY